MVTLWARDDENKDPKQKCKKEKKIDYSAYQKTQILIKMKHWL